jgi:DNA gyrase subunit A
LVDGQGNFGSVDGDSPAAMRYTEARLKKIAEEMLADIEKNTVDFRLNFDDTLEEPTVLPAKIPNLLINGSSGIAVGMATNMAPHNLSEVVDATIAYIDNREITIAELMHYVKAPDFPTGGTIYGYEGVRDAFETGRGRIVLRAKSTVETEGGRDKIIVTEIPYQLNKAEMIKKTADLINDKKIDGITEIRDESDRDGMRIVYELRRDAITNVVLNNLYKYTSLQSSFSVNNIALVKGRPEVLNLKNLIVHFVDHRHEVIVRRTQYDLEQAEKRAHILEGFLIALDNLDAVINLIRSSQTPEIAKEGLMENFKLSEIQAKAVLALTLSRLTGLERDKIRAEYDELMKTINELKEILANESLRMGIIKTELAEMKEKYGDERKTDIVYSADEMRIEDIIADEDIVITISHMGYIKRTLLSEYRTQKRGGTGSLGSNTRDSDFLEHIFTATMHNYMLLFTQKGKIYWLRAFEVPEGQKNGKGRPIQNLINIEPDDKIMAYVNVKDLNDDEYINNNYVVLCTNKGTIKKTLLEAYSRPRANGINAITVRDGEILLEARLTNGNCHILMALRSGRACRFPEKTVRPMGRNASGVRGITLAGEDDEVIGMLCADVNTPTTILVVSEKGYGKRTFLDDPETGEPEYRITNRGGKGVKTLNITDKTGKLVAIKGVTDAEDLMIITKNGIAIRTPVDSLRTMGRNTQGVRLINLRSNDTIASIAQAPREEVEEVELSGEEGEITENGAGESETPTSEA